MYLLHAMAGRTTILLTGRGLGLIEQALGIGRDLAPATFVFEDIDLVAAERTMEFGSQGVLFELLNQMEGLAEDEDLLFVLTTNRPDLIEPALAARPGRVDLALEIPLPDADGRRRLLGLYGAGIEIDARLSRSAHRALRTASAARSSRSWFARPGYEPRLRTASRPPPRTCAACSTTCSKSARP